MEVDILEREHDFFGYKVPQIKCFHGENAWRLNCKCVGYLCNNIPLIM